MKLQARQVEGFVKRPDPAVAIFLLHGPDEGLIAERAVALIRRFVADPHDPFGVVDLQGEVIRLDPGRLVDEALAYNLMGGRRVVRIRDAGDGIAPALKALLDGPQPEAMVVIEAAEPPAVTKLRGMAERSDRAAALPCYRDDAGNLESVVSATLSDHGLVADPPTFQALVSHLGGDRGVTRAEIAKLALYVGDRPGGRITEEDVEACIGDARALLLDNAIDAVGLRRLDLLEDALPRLFAEGVHPQLLLRSTARNLQRLLRLRLEVEAGSTPDAVVAAIRQPMPPSAKAALLGAVRAWQADALAAGLAALWEAIDRSTQQGVPEELMCRDVLGRLCGGSRASLGGTGGRAPGR